MLGDDYNEYYVQMPKAWHWYTLKNEPSTDIITEEWEEHRKIHASYVPLLNYDGVKDLKKWLLNNDYSNNAASLLAENIPCDYLNDIEKNCQFPRISKQKRELFAIQESANNLKRDLLSTSGKTLGELSLELIFPDGLWKPSADRPVVSEVKYPEFLKIRSVAEDIIFRRVTDTEPYQYVDNDCTTPNPLFIFVLEELSNAAQRLIGQSPEDKGGEVSGSHDSTGSKTRIRLVIEARAFLRFLGVPYGSQKGGPVSKLIALIHRATRDEEPTWADRYAAMAPDLERVCRWKELEQACRRTGPKPKGQRMLRS